MEKEFEFRHVDLVIAGKSINGLRGIKYMTKTEKERLYGRGNKAIAIQSGNEACEGEVKFLQWEIEALIAAIKAKDASLKLTDVSFDMVVSYQAANKVIVDVIHKAEFEGYEKGFDQGDKFMEISMKFLCTDITYQRP